MKVDIKTTVNAQDDHNKKINTIWMKKKTGDKIKTEIVTQSNCYIIHLQSFDPPPTAQLLFATVKNII